MGTEGLDGGGDKQDLSCGMWNSEEMEGKGVGDDMTPVECYSNTT